MTDETTPATDIRARSDVVRVVVVDDHALFRAGVVAELGERVDVVGQAADVDGAIAVITQTDPQVVLLDVHLPGGDGHAVIAAVHPTMPEVRFLAVSVSDEADDVISLVRAGARGYVTKHISGDELVDAVQRVADGDAVFSPRLAGFVLDAFSARSRHPRIRSSTSSHPASTRSCGTWRAVTPTRRSRATLHISVKTVETHASVGAAQAPAQFATRAHTMGDGSPHRVSSFVRSIGSAPVRGSGQELLSGTTSRRRWMTSSMMPYSLACSAVNQRSRSESCSICSTVWPVCSAMRSAMQPLDVDHLLGLDGDVGRLALEARRGLVHHDPGVRQGVALARRAGAQQELAHRGARGPCRWCRRRAATNCMVS